MYNRVDSNKDFMGLITLKGHFPKLKEAKTAKNYLDEKVIEEYKKYQQKVFSQVEIDYLDAVNSKYELPKKGVVLSND